MYVHVLVDEAAAADQGQYRYDEQLVADIYYEMRAR